MTLRMGCTTCLMQGAACCLVCTVTVDEGHRPFLLLPLLLPCGSLLTQLGSLCSCPEARWHICALKDIFNE